MYTQPLFAETRPDVLHALIRRHPLGLLMRTVQQGLQADLMPMLLLVDKANSRCRLQGHVGRGHDLAHDLAEEAAAQPGGEGVPVLVQFTGPNHFIRPRWYVNGQASRRNAPSWNHASVQVRGRLRLAPGPAWMQRHLAAMTAEQEAGRADRWDAGEDLTPAVLGEAVARLVGWELDVEEMAGRRFLSQQRTPADRASIVRHLRAETTGTAHDLAALIEAVDATPPGTGG